MTKFIKKITIFFEFYSSSSLNITLLAPTIRIPIKAINAPVILYFYILILRNTIDKINVMTIDPPLIIWWTEGGKKFNAIYKKVDEHPSKNAGKAK